MMTKKNQFSGKSIRRLLLQAVRALRTNKFDDAVTYLDEVLKREPDNARGNAILFTTYYKNEQFDEAQEVGDKAAELNPASQYILNNQACLLIGKKRFSDAKDLLNQLIDKYGETPQWLYNLGLAYSHNNQPSEAIQHFKSVLDIDPNHHQSAIQLSSLQIQLGLHEDAAETLNLLRLITSSQPTTSAGYIRHSIQFGLLNKKTAKQEITMWGDQFIPKNRQYPQSSLPKKGKPLTFGFIIGSVSGMNWELIIKPLLEQLKDNGHDITIYWHNKKRPKTDLTLVQSRQLSDADFARAIRKQMPDVLIDIGGMHIQTRERALGLQLAKKQFGWLQHPGVYSSSCVDILDSRLDKNAFAISTPKGFALPNCKKVGKDVIAAIGCADGLSEKNIQLWSKVLKKLSKKKILLDVEKKNIQERLVSLFKENGIAKNRIKFAQNITFKSGDIVLTNLFNNPIAQTCLAHAQGATIFTLKGELFPAQQTSRLLEQTNNDQFISNTEKEYVDNIVKLVKKDNFTKLTPYQTKKSEILNIEKFAQQFIDSLY